MKCAPAFVVILVLTAAAHAQHNHDQHHAFYQNWVNKNEKGCCNDRDCGELREENERVGSSGVEVRIEGKWCLVQPHHYLKRGNAPDWSVAHVCVQKQYPYVAQANVCERLLCYQPKPGI